PSLYRRLRPSLALLALYSLHLLFFFYRSPAHRDLHSFPTRRSSDLLDRTCRRCRTSQRLLAGSRRTKRAARPRRACCQRYAFSRSEEHTSELQSRGHLVCRLLLEKKKINTAYRGTYAPDLRDPVLGS